MEFVARAPRPCSVRAESMGGAPMPRVGGQITRSWRPPRLARGGAVLGLFLVRVVLVVLRPPFVDQGGEGDGALAVDAVPADVDGELLDVGLGPRRHFRAP